MRAGSSTAAPPQTVLRVANVPYLNCAPFFEGLSPHPEWAWSIVSPRQLGMEAEAGQIDAGPMAAADFLRLQDRFERVGDLGIAVRGRCPSVTLFSRVPLRQLDGAMIAVSDSTSTTALLLRLILERRYGMAPREYRRGADSQEADAVLLIGDEALAFRATNRWFPYETDLAFEWWLWQHLPCVFAVWVVRNDVGAETKQCLQRELVKALGVNRHRLPMLAEAAGQRLGQPADFLVRYLERFVYRFGQAEERALERFSQLLHEHRLL